MSTAWLEKSDFKSRIAGVNPAAKPMEHLILRQWRDSDLEPFAEMNADAEVMRYFPATMSRAESEAVMQRYRCAIDERGWGLWAVEV